MKHLQPNVLYGGPEPEDVAYGAQSLSEFLHRRLVQHMDSVILVGSTDPSRLCQQPFDDHFLTKLSILQIDGLTNETLTASALLRSALRVSAALNAHGIGADDTVAMCSENRLDIAVAIFGVLLHGGATLVTVNPTYTARELQHAFRLTRPRVVFASAAAIGAVQSTVAADACGFVEIVVVLDDVPADQRSPKTIAMQEFVAVGNQQRGGPNRKHYSGVPRVMAEKVALILFSSGTTGLPKGVELTEHNILVSLAQIE